MNQKTSENQSSASGIYHDFTIDASLENVYKAITEPQHLVNWWPLKCEGKPQLGMKYNFFFSSEYDWYGQVVKCSPNESFHIKMTRADADWNPTTFGFDLEEKNGKVLLHFTHLNWLENNAHFRKTSFCWAMLLKGLKDYIEKDIILPFEERS